MSTNIDSLSIQINSNASGALTQLENLTKSLSTLKSNAKLTTVNNNLSKLAVSLRELQSASSGLAGIQKLGESLSSLSGLGKMTNLTSALTQLKKIPEITQSLDHSTLARFSNAMKELVTALMPLANVMSTISAGFSRLPANIRSGARAVQSFQTTAQTAAQGTNKLTVSLNTLYVKFFAIYAVARRVFAVMGEWVATASQYEENINLFSVSMRDYFDEAMAYAETVQDVMGIDLSQWVRNQGIFSAIATGFGLAKEQAYAMSRGLTELAYDLSSFFNISLDAGGEGALDKVKSAIAGELEPLRRLGFALDQATLQQVAFSHGVTESFTSMTQAEKALLRYTAMVEQATSMGAVGDMARTIDTFANQVRILKQRFTQLGRAAGQAIIPALQAILPWVQAVIVLFTRAAQAVASFFGFSLTTIDYSGLDGVADSATDAEEALSGAGSAAKDLLNATMGFDELNVISEPSGGGGGGGSTAGLSEWAKNWNIESLWDKALLEDINSEVDELVERIEDFIKPLKKVFKWLWEIKELVVAGFAIAAVVKLWGKVQTVWQGFLGLKIVNNFLDGFTLIRAVGGNVFESIVGGLDNIRMHLSTLQKVAVAAVAAVVEFTVVKSVVKDLTLETKNLGAGLAELIVVLGAVGTAMYTALGPWGLLLAAVVAVTAAAVGFAEAAEELMIETVQSMTFDGVGQSLDTLKARLELVTEQYRVQNEEVIRLSEAMEESRSEIERIGLSLDVMTAALGASGTVTQEEVDQLKSEFATLYEEIKQNMESSANIILTSLAGALAEATPEVQESIETLIGEYQRFVYATQGRAGEIEVEINRIYDSLVGMIPGSDEYAEAMQALDDLYMELGYLQGGMSDAEWQWGQTVANFNAHDFDWSSVEDAQQLITDISTSGTEALAAVADARDAALKKIDEDILYVSKYGTEEDLQLLYDVRAQLEENYAAQEADIKSEIESIFTEISNALAFEANKIADEAILNYDDINWWDKNKTPEQYATQVVETFTSTVFTPISDALKQASSDLELDAETVGISAVEGILNGVKLETEGTGGWVHFNAFGLDSLRGYVDGIEENLGEVEEAGTAIGDTVSEATRDALDINSPSGVYRTIGTNVTAGFLEGVKENWDQVANFLVSGIKEMGTQFHANTDGISEAWTATWSDILQTSKQKWQALQSWWDSTGKKKLTASHWKAQFKPISTTVSETASDVKTEVTSTWETLSAWYRGNVAQSLSETNWQSRFAPLSDTLSDVLSDAWSEVKRFFSTDAWEKLVNNAMDSVQEHFKLPSLPSIKLSVTFDTTIAGNKKSVADALGLPGWPHLKWKGYAQGGFPSMGELFVAREAGPELVGSIGNRTAVANNDQIVEAVSKGVYSAVVTAMSQSQSGSQPLHIYLDGKEITASVEKHQSERGRSILGNRMV